MTAPAVHRYLVRLTGQRGDGTPLVWSEVLVSRRPLTRIEVRDRVVWALEEEHRTRLGVQSCRVTPASPALHAAAAGAPFEALGVAA